MKKIVYFWGSVQLVSLGQFFSTGVPRHTSVPWATTKCAAKFFPIAFTNFQTNIEKYSQACVH